VNGGFNAIIASSYTAGDADIEGADMDYAALEAMLAEQISGIERTYQGYDEYRYDLDEIGHDPHVLASYLTAKYFMYSRTQVQMDLIALFGQQYDLKLTPVVETRYREELRVETYVYTDPATGKPAVGYYTYTETVAYDYYVLYVSLSNRSLDNIVSYNMDAEQAEMYAAYLQAQGNRPELFDGNPYASRKAYLVYDIPPEALSDTVFAAMIFEAEKHLGRAYVWGGASPSTGFDCSGYVSWVINHSGWNVGRLGAKALFNICTPVSVMDAQPGDLIFFWKTYNAPDPNAPTHVGIYVGGGMMIHCGNPISYADVTSPYWLSHFYSFGRLN
jgi:cell wall-associated NlpC family hydrolase